MSIQFTLYLVVLFVVLTPGVFVSLPPKAGKLTVALTHAVVFVVVYQLTSKMVMQVLDGFDGMSMPCAKDTDCVAPMKCKDAKCVADRGIWQTHVWKALCIKCGCFF